MQQKDVSARPAARSASPAPRHAHPTYSNSITCHPTVPATTAVFAD